MLKSILVLFLGLFSFCAFSQLDDTHYFPPLTQEGNNSITQQAFYLSTPETTPFDVSVYLGNSTTPLIVLTGLSNTTPLRYNVANGTNNITVVGESSVGVVILNSGLRFVAHGGQKFYTNYRSKSNAQAGSLTCKGKRALGTDFRWGGIPSITTSTAPAIYNAICMMASEDNTIITIKGYHPNCTFRSGNNANGITSDVITITLNANESYILEAIPSNSVTANFNGWLGATISSTKPIAASSVGLTSLNDSSRDVTLDQIVPTNVIGKQYGFIRGNGSNASEFPLIIATEDNTRVLVNGVFYKTIQNGEAIEIPGSFYSGSTAGANLFVETNKKVYAFQSLAGDLNKIQTNGMNFIPPLVCLLPTSFDHISDIDDIAGNPTAASAITIIASASSLDSDIKVYQNNIEILKPSPVSFNGTSEWKSFFIDKLNGDIKVASTGNIVVGFFVNDGGNAGYAGYFSGFDEVPETDVDLAVEGECLPDGEIKLIDDSRPAYQWYKNGVEIPGATSYKVKMDGVGEYYADIITDSGCIYRSESIDITDPNREILFNNCILKAKDSLQETYQWYRNDTLLMGETKFTIIPNVPGVYHAEMTTKTGCVYKTNTHKTLYDIASPQIDTTYLASGCIPDGIIKLSKKDPNNYYTYQWYKDGSIVPSATTKEYIITKEGTYYTEITNPGGCVILSDTISIQHPSLKLSRDLNYGCIPNGYLKAVDSLQKSYQWFRNNKAIVGATNFKIDLDSIGTYAVDITTPYGCVYRSESQEVTHCYDLEITKVADKTEILEGGDELNYTIDVYNKGSLPITSLEIKEILPNQLLYRNHTTLKGSWSIANSTWNIGTLNSKEKASLILETSSKVTKDTVAFINTIKHYQNEIDSKYSVDDLTETVKIINGEIEISSVNAELERPFRIIKGDILNFTFAIKNTGKIPLSHIELTNNLFSNNLNGNYISGDVNLDGILDLNETWIYTIPYIINQTEINNLQVTSTSFVKGTQPNTFSQYDELEYVYTIDPNYVVPYIDLSLLLSGNGPDIYINDDVDIQLKLNSDHTANATELNITTSLPSGLELQNYHASHGTFNADTGIWKISVFEKNTEAILKIKAKMLAEGDHTINAEIISFNELDTIPNNNSTSISFTPLCHRVFNEFSPNDDGINDHLVIQCIEFNNQVDLKIFNRNGVLVYENNNYQNEFNGYGNKGLYINQNKRLPNGTYFYVLKIDENSSEKNGWIYINR